ncbi:molybdopterin molybdotransferase [Bradyrhizobium sp. USDA 4448]
MAQLSDDCFAFGGPMMSVDEAVGLITARVSAIADIETVALDDADGRVLARDIAAPLPLPPFTNSAVDGYAVGNVDLPQEAEQAFPLDGRIQAGGSAQAPIKPGHTARIFTGAPMPPGAGTVFMQEDVRVDASGKIVLPSGLKPGANVRPAGEDIPVGHVALRAGQRLRPQHVALAAAFGLVRFEVVRRIRVAVFSTGDELASPGESRAASQLFDSNRFMLMAMLRRLGCEVSDLGILRDERTSLANGLKQVAGGHDLILTTGGVSTGEEDHVKAAVESVGSLVLWRMAIKPGRPVAMGIIGGTPRDRAARQSRRELCHLCPRGAANGARARRQSAGTAGADPVARGVHLQEKAGPPRICACLLATWTRWYARSRQVSARRGRAVVVVGGDRWPD